MSMGFNTNNIGINDQDIDKLVLDIFDCCEEIQKKLNKISDIVSDTQNFFSCENGDSFRKKFNMYSSNFSTVVSNLSSYATDFINLKGKVDLLDDKLSFDVKRASNQIGDKIQTIPNVSIVNVNNVPNTNTGSKKSWR